MGWQQYVVGWAGQHGGYDLRRGPVTVRGWLWLAYAVARGLAPLRVRPGAVSLLGLVLAVAVPVVVGRGSFGLLTAAALVLLASFADTLDRALTVVTARSPALASIRVTVTGGVGEAAWLTGFWLAGVPGLLVVAVGVLTGLHELVRREARSAGMSRIGVQTIAERPVRVSVVVLGLGLAGLAGMVGWQFAAGLLTVATTGWLLLMVLALSQLAGAIRRSVR